jgi:hypothetical protein
MEAPNPPKELLEQIVKGNCVAFIGAGPSQAAGLPGWKQMLTQMIEWGREHGVKLTDCVDLENGIKADKLLTVAEELYERMGKEKFRKFMKELFRRSDLKPTESHLLLPRIPFCAVATLNYDPLIESVYSSQKGILPHTFTHKDVPELSGALRSKEFFVLKAHGTIDRIETIILTHSDYRRLIHTNSAYRQFLKQLFTQKTALFIGFGLTDPDLLLMLNELKADFDGYTGTHYALTDVSEMPEYEQRRFEKDYGIEIIPYHKSAPDHPEVRGFLKKLADYNLAKRAALQNIIEAEKVFNDDPHYRLVTQFFVEAKHPNAAEICPLDISATLQFNTETAEGKKALEDYRQHLATGSPITIKGEHVMKFMPPEIMRSLMGEEMEAVELQIGTWRGEESFLLRLEAESPDGERASFDYIDFNVAQHGNEQITLDNETQPVPWKVQVMIDKRGGKSQIKFNFKTTGVNTWQALQQIQFARVMSKGAILRTRNVATNLLIDETSIASGKHQAFDERWVALVESSYFIQTTLRIPINLPEQITNEDANNVFLTEHILKTGRAGGTAAPWIVEATVEAALNGLAVFKEENTQAVTLVMRDVYETNVLGTKVVLGPILVNCPKAYITNEDFKKLEATVHSAQPGDIVSLTLTPFEDCPVEGLFVNWLPPEERTEALKHPGLREAHPQLYDPQPGVLQTSSTNLPVKRQRLKRGRQ